MRCSIELSKAALIHNLNVFKRDGGLQKMMPVIKSNAYGHGFFEVLAELMLQPIEWLGVNYLHEALDARQAKWAKKILVLGPVAPRDFAAAAAADLEIILGDDYCLTAWFQLKRSEQPNLHIKIDTGMSRQGFLPDEIPALLSRLKPHADKITGIATHFANVEDVTDQSFARTQRDRFLNATRQFNDAGIHPIQHLAASSASLLMPETKADLDRVGISLYGFWPSRATQISCNAAQQPPTVLRPVLSWFTEVALTKPISAGSFVGYGCTFQAPAAMTIAVLPVGYYEGYPRLAGKRGAHVLIGGKRCSIIGRICMNMMMVDISHLSKVRAGDQVTLIGSDGESEITADDLADWAETINYEIVTCLNPKIPRRFIDDLTD